MKKIVTLLLCIMIVLSLVACSKSGDSHVTTVPNPINNNPDPEGYAYYDGKNFGGYEFRILNYESYVGTNCTLAPAKQISGDLINNKMYERNLFVEEKLGVIIVEDAKGYVEMGGFGGQKDYDQLVINSVLAEDRQNYFDVANVFLNWNVNLITQGVLTDLSTVNTLHMDEDYWDKSVNEGLAFGGKSFVASSQFTLMPFDLTWATFFNEDMINDRQLESPYSLVDNNQWTLAKMLEYVQAVTNLNGDDTWAYQEGGKAIYGIASHTDATSAMVVACDNVFTTTNQYGEIIANVENEHLYNTVERVQSLFSPSQGHSTIGFATPNSMTDPSGYVNLFKNGRALFLEAEIKSASELRNMENAYGVLPMPKYDETQTQYYATMGAPALLSIPANQEDLSRTGLILDALSYESGDVMNAYYTTTVKHKNVQNANSERMLDLIHGSFIVEFGSFFEFTAHYFDALRKGIVAENFNPSSVGETEADTINLRLEKFFEALEKLEQSKTSKDS